jgi:hypothetical protein
VHFPTRDSQPRWLYSLNGRSPHQQTGRLVGCDPNPSSERRSETRWLARGRNACLLRSIGVAPEEAFVATWRAVTHAGLVGSDERVQQQQKRFLRARRAKHDFFCGDRDRQRRHGRASRQQQCHSRGNRSIARHQSNFRPNCTWRAVVAVLVMIPAVGETPEGVKTTSFGWLKFARLRMLKISARN